MDSDLPDIPHVSPGEFPRAEDYNNLVDAATREIPRQVVQRRSAEGGENIIGVLADDLTTSGSATVTVKTGSPGSESGSNTIEAYNWMLASGKKIASGAKVVCASINGYWYVIAASTCPVDA